MRVKPTGISLQFVSALDEPVGSLMVETDDEVCAKHLAHAWGEKRGRKLFVRVEVSQGCPGRTASGASGRVT